VHPAAPQPAPWLCVVSHAIPQPVQFATEVIGVSHPLVFGALASQSP
jgi:hypothetical protein